MQIDIVTQNTELTKGLERAVSEKLQTLNFYKKHQKSNSGTEKESKANHQEKIHSHVSLIVDGHRHRVDMTITGTGDRVLNASSSSDDMYKSIHQAGNIIERLWRKQKDARLSTRRKDSIKRLNTM